MRRLNPLLLMLVVAGVGCGGSTDRVIVGVGTTLHDSGFIELVVDAYERQNDVHLSVISESSQRLFDLASRGEVGFLLTHEPDGLAAFVESGAAAASERVFASRFLIVGPPELVATIAPADAASVFGEIAERNYAFVGRADGSGTAIAEQALWRRTTASPFAEEWYTTTGQGMGLTLQVASQRRAFVLVEEGTWLGTRDVLDLTEVRLTEDLPNEYSATVVVGGQQRAAMAFFDWLRSPQGLDAIETANEDTFGAIVYRHATG